MPAAGSKIPGQSQTGSCKPELGQIDHQGCEQRWFSQHWTEEHKLQVPRVQRCAQDPLRLWLLVPPKGTTRGHLVSQTLSFHQSRYKTLKLPRLLVGWTFEICHVSLKINCSSPQLFLGIPWLSRKKVLSNWGCLKI